MWQKQPSGILGGAMRWRIELLHTTNNTHSPHVLAKCALKAAPKHVQKFHMLSNYCKGFASKCFFAHFRHSCCPITCQFLPLLPPQCLDLNDALLALAASVFSQCAQTMLLSKQYEASFSSFLMLLPLFSQGV